eukprot:15469149-Alexandrium_andersonii.AAC.1
MLGVPDERIDDTHAAPALASIPLVDARAAGLRRLRNSQCRSCVPMACPDVLWGSRSNRRSRWDIHCLTGQGDHDAERDSAAGRAGRFARMAMAKLTCS